jgi:hypothetical protein
MKTGQIRVLDKSFPGADSGGGGGAPGARFWRKIVIFHTKYPKNFRASLRNWKKYDFFV